MKARFKKIRRLGSRIIEYFAKLELPSNPEGLAVTLERFKARIDAASNALTNRTMGADTSSSESRNKLVIKDEILKDHIDPMRTLVRAMGKAMRKGKNTARLKDKLVKAFPAIPVTGDESAFVAYVKGYIKKADKYRAEFIAHGASESFIDDLQAKLDEFETASSERMSGFIGRTEGLETVEKELEDAYTDVGFFDAVIKRIMPRGDPRRAVWSRISKLERTLPPLSKDGEVPGEVASS